MLDWSRKDGRTIPLGNCKGFALERGWIAGGWETEALLEDGISIANSSSSVGIWGPAAGCALIPDLIPRRIGGRFFATGPASSARSEPEDAKPKEELRGAGNVGPPRNTDDTEEGATPFVSAEKEGLSDLSFSTKSLISLFEKQIQRKVSKVYDPKKKKKKKKSTYTYPVER